MTERRHGGWNRRAHVSNCKQEMFHTTYLHHNTARHTAESWFVLTSLMSYPVSAVTHEKQATVETISTCPPCEENQDFPHTLRCSTT